MKQCVCFYRLKWKWVICRRHSGMIYTKRVMHFARHKSPQHTWKLATIYFFTRKTLAYQQKIYHKITCKWGESNYISSRQLTVYWVQFTRIFQIIKSEKLFRQKSQLGNLWEEENVNWLEEILKSPQLNPPTNDRFYYQSTIDRVAQTEFSLIHEVFQGSTWKPGKELNVIIVAPFGTRLHVCLALPAQWLWQ